MSRPWVIRPCLPAIRDGDAGLDDLRRAILQLPDEYREPLVLQVLGGIDYGGNRRSSWVSPSLRC